MPGSPLFQPRKGSDQRKQDRRVQRENELVPSLAEVRAANRIGRKPLWRGTTVSQDTLYPTDPSARIFEVRLKELTFDEEAINGGPSFSEDRLSATRTVKALADDYLPEGTEVQVWHDHSRRRWHVAAPVNPPDNDVLELWTGTIDRLEGLAVPFTWTFQEGTGGSGLDGSLLFRSNIGYTDLEPIARFTASFNFGYTFRYVLPANNQEATLYINANWDYIQDLRRSFQSSRSGDFPDTVNGIGLYRIDPPTFPVTNLRIEGENDPFNQDIEFDAAFMIIRGELLPGEPLP